MNSWFMQFMTEFQNLQVFVPIASTYVAISTPILAIKFSDALKNRKNFKESNYVLARNIDHTNTLKPTYIKLSARDKEEMQKAINALKIPEELQNIADEFFEKIDPDEQRNCVRNLESLGYKHISFKDDIKLHLKNFLSSTTAAAWYIPGLNKIEDLEMMPTRKVLCHEFLHMASANSICAGFQGTRYDVNTGKYNVFGSGINEGYTELLTCRLFNYDLKLCTYKIPVKLTRLMETFFDNPEDMKKAYFNGSLEEPYIEFCKYGSNEEFWSIMHDIDNYAYAPMPFDFINSIGTQMKLYEIIKRSGNAEKIKKFEDILDEDKFIALTRKGNNFKLTAEMRKEKHI